MKRLPECGRCAVRYVCVDCRADERLTCSPVIASRSLRHDIDTASVLTAKESFQHRASDEEPVSPRNIVVEPEDAEKIQVHY